MSKEWKIENSQNETREYLQELKKEILWKIIDKKKKDDITLYIGKNVIIDYLLGEENDEIEIIKNLKGKLIKRFCKSYKELERISKEIKECNTTNELRDLEESINNWRHTSTENTTPSQTTNTPHQTPQHTHIEEYPESARVWEAKEVPNNKEKRMKRLFPNWTPESEEEMEKYIKTIQVPAYTEKWEKRTFNLTIHKKLANEFSSIFQEMYNNKIPVNPEKTWWYNRRMVRWSSNKRSQHSYWSAVDVNYNVNWWWNYGPDVPSSPYYNTQKTVNIWKRHWFNRWWDWNKKDPMHFSYINW